MRIPDRIYLQLDSSENGEISDSAGVTWSEERINDSDVEYVRADGDSEKKRQLFALRDALPEMIQKLR